MSEEVYVQNLTKDYIRVGKDHETGASLIYLEPRTVVTSFNPRTGDRKYYEGVNVGVISKNRMGAPSIRSNIDRLFKTISEEEYDARLKEIARNPNQANDYQEIINNLPIDGEGNTANFVGLTQEDPSIRETTATYTIENTSPDSSTSATPYDSTILDVPAIEVRREDG